MPSPRAPEFEPASWPEQHWRRGWRGFRGGRRPPWWPADQPWPPAGPPGAEHWRRMRGRLFWRVALALGLVFLFGAGSCSLVFWLAATLAGLVHLPPGAASTGLIFGGLLALAIGLAGLGLGARSLRRVTAPIGDLMEAAGQVAEGDYTARVPELGPREMRALAHAFNDMAARLEMNEDQRRRLLADVTHELRTPLTIIQGNLEGLLDGVYPRDDAHLSALVEETRVLSRLIEDLRTLALAEAGALKLQREPTDLAALLVEAAASFRGQAEAAGVTLATGAAPDLPLLEVDSVRIREVVGNLIANALRYTPAGGRVRVDCALAEDGRSVAIAVTDTGQGIAPADLPHVFDRFYKSAESRGSGLGLAIAKNLVAAHGGEISAHSAGAAGQGAAVRFTLPVEAA